MSAREVSYQIEAIAIFDGDSFDLTSMVTGLTSSLDMDAVTFSAATMTLQDPSDALQDVLDPRSSEGTVLSFRVTQIDRDTGQPESYFPGSRLYSADDEAWAIMWIQDTDWNPLTGVFTIVAAGGESRALDKINVSTGTVNTGAGNLNALITYALTQVFGSGTPLSDSLGASSITIPSGDRRRWQPGQSCWDLIESEVSTAGGRLWADATGEWAVSLRDDAPRSIYWGEGAVYGTTYDPDGGIPISDMHKRLSRRGDWYDSSLVLYEYDDAAGTRIRTYQAQTASTTGASRGRLTTYQRPPGTAYILAELIRTRSLKRGCAWEIVGRCDFRARPGRTLSITTPTGNINAGTIRAVEWDLTTGDMTMTTEVGRPVYTP